MTDTPALDPVPLMLAPTPLPEKQGLRAVRACHTRSLLAYIGTDGLYLFDRRSNEQHLLTWEMLRPLFLTDGILSSIL